MAIIAGPDGRTWSVRRRWHGWDDDRFTQVWSKDTLKQGMDVADGFGLAGEIPVVGILFAVVAIVAFVVMVLLPLFILVVDLLLLAVFVMITLLGRILLRRPWTIEAKAFDGEVRRWEVVGWRASGEHARLVRRQLELGMPLPPEGIASGP